MKTSIYFVLIASILFLGCSKSDDDLNLDLINSQLKPELNAKGSTKIVNFSVSHYFTSAYWTPLICDGIEVGSLEGMVNVHCVMFGHYDPDFPGNLNKFIWQWMVMNYSGSLTNPATGEMFIIKESDKIEAGYSSYNWHSNIRGDKGSHFIIFGSSTDEDPWFKIDKAICPGQGE